MFFCFMKKKKGEKMKNFIYIMKFFGNFIYVDNFELESFLLYIIINDFSH